MAITDTIVASANRFHLNNSCMKIKIPQKQYGEFGAFKVPDHFQDIEAIAVLCLLLVVA